MSWDSIWENIFQDRKQWGKYPIEDLVRFMAKNYYSVQDRQAVKVLEIGCGPGAGPGWFIAREGFNYTAIDGSPTAIEFSRKRFIEDGLNGEFVIGDFEKLPWSDCSFDVVIDIVSLQCNSELSARNVIKEIYRVLKNGGKHFSYTAKAGCWGDNTGEKVDNTTYFNIMEGPFANMGVMRFATEDSLKNLYQEFINLEIEYMTRSVQNNSKEISHWILSCQKE